MDCIILSDVDDDDIEIKISSDDSNDKKYTNKKKTRRGLDHIDLQYNSDEMEKELMSSAIYTSRIYNYRKDIYECLSTVQPKISDVLKRPLDTENKIYEEVDNSDKLQESNGVSPKRSCIIEDESDLQCSPSPPPKAATKKVTKESRKLFNEIEKTKNLYNKTRLINDNPAEYEILEPVLQSSIGVKFKWKGTIFKISMEKDQKFTSVLPELAEKFQICASDILLVNREETIQPGNTPFLINLSSTDIIDCYLIKGKNQSSDENSINLKVQANDSRKKVIISINKFSPLSYLMEEYVKIKGLPLEKLKFKFDGDSILPTDTPDDLEMEDDNCIDVIISS